MLYEVQRDASVFTWASYDLIFDSPDKSQPDSAETAASIVTSLKKSVVEAQRELIVISPYFVLRDPEIEGFQELRDKGIEMAVLTNSLASNNHTISHSGYMPVNDLLFDVCTTNHSPQITR